MNLRHMRNCELFFCQSILKELFEDIVYFPENDLPAVLMGDDKTKLEVKGYGYMSFSIHGHKVLHLALYLPWLGTTLISVKQHMQNMGCYFLEIAQETHLASKILSFILKWKKKLI